MRDEAQKWDGCRCSKCGKTRDEAHRWGGCECSECGKTRNGGHDDRATGSIKCSKCGKIRPSAVHDAILRRNVEQVRALLEINPRLVSGRGGSTWEPSTWTPLHVAADKGCEEIAALLLAKGAVVGTRDSSNWTPLHPATYRGHKEMELLLASGADPNARDNEG
jgi:hypothetical protein